MRWAWLLVALVGCAKGADDFTETGDPAGEPPEVYINELMASNASVLTDETGAFPDWVELYNAEASAVDLSGFTLTDDLASPAKWVFPEGTQVGAGAFLIVYCDGDVADGPLHTNFSLSASGEALGLFMPPAGGGAQVDVVESYDPQLPDVSLARQPDGGESWVADETPTPGGANN